MDIVALGLPLIAVLLISLGINVIIVLTRSLHLSHTTRMHDTTAVQSAHKSPTPRIGGLGVVVAAMVGIVLFFPGDARWPMAVFAVSVLPVFLIGLAEDLGWDMSPARRLVAAAGSSAVMVLGAGVWIGSSGLPGLDTLLMMAPFAIVFTILWCTGLCHAFNLIDGVNGLSATTGILIALGLSAIALFSGQTGMAVLALSLVPALLGFLALNWPLGKVFLGDAGAYSVGHLLAWVGILIAAASPDVAGVAVALLFFWPVADTLFAIYRRYRAGRRADQPDRLHFHQLVMRGLEIQVLGRDRRGMANSLTTVVLAPAIAAPVFVGVLTWDKPYAALISVVVFAVLFVAAYLAGITYVRERARGGGSNGRSRTRSVSSDYAPEREAEATAAAVSAARPSEGPTVIDPVSPPAVTHKPSQSDHYLH